MSNASPISGKKGQIAYDGKPGVYPSRFSELKKEITKGHEEAIIKSWNELLGELEIATKKYAEAGPQMVPQVEFSDLETLSPEEVERIRRIGSVLVKNVVDDDEALEYKQDLKDYVKANPHVQGFPQPIPQFFEMYWSKSQLRARSHPNVLKLTQFLNTLYHGSEESVVDLRYNLAYADRFRIRTFSKKAWGEHFPHIDGGSIEKWEDPQLRSTFLSILKGDWKNYDPYDITGRLNGNTDLYGRPNQASVFRTFQGWLSMSSTGPDQGTLRVYPDLLLSSAYLLLRPFFRPINKDLEGEEFLAASNWEFDTSDPAFPGIYASETEYGGQRLTEQTHPHLRVGSAIVSVPHVNPGDAVFWHCDVIHSVEQHMKDGSGDSSVMYIPAVPLTPQNVEYLAKHRDAYLIGMAPPDFPQGEGEANFVNKGLEEHIYGVEGRMSMGLEQFPIRRSEDDQSEIRKGAEEAIRIANKLLKGVEV